MLSVLGTELRRLRESAGLSYTQVTIKTELSTNYIFKLETGSRAVPSPDVLRRLAKAYGASFAELMKLAGHLQDEDMPDILRSAGGLDFSFADEAALFSRAAAD